MIISLALSALFGIGSTASLAVLIVASLSLAFIEPVSDMLLFDSVKKSEQENIIPIFGTSRYFGSLVTRFVVGFVLIYFSPTVTVFAMIAILAIVLFQTRYLKN